ncbi:MAG: alpha/beta hydrolase [Methanobacterium sp.]|uniref:alpha/beta fold hydrolase n=1 Tax=Methanobacterium sp. TaxID=2164 RepID=UPI003D64624E|nr:alpha/beta hydrolase [Methanobacterium sp.]
MPQIKLNEIKINYKDKGQGFPVILIHGLSDDLNLWEPLIPELTRYYRVIALDLRGHGNSSKPDIPYSINDFSRDVYTLLVNLNIKKAHFMGLSMGGALAQQFTVDHPGMVQSMILISSFTYLDSNSAETLLMLRESLIKGGFKLFFDEMLPLVLTSDFIREYESELLDIRAEKIETEYVPSIIHSIDACLEFNLKNQISAISKPTLIISGKEDVLIPLELQEQTHRLIKDSTWEIIGNTGHNVIIPQNIPYLSKTILEFLKK